MINIYSDGRYKESIRNKYFILIKYKMDRNEADKIDFEVVINITYIGKDDVGFDLGFYISNKKNKTKCSYPMRNAHKITNLQWLELHHAISHNFDYHICTSNDSTETNLYIGGDSITFIVTCGSLIYSTHNFDINNINKNSLLNGISGIITKDDD